MICPLCDGEGWLEVGPDILYPCPDCDGCGLAYCCEGAPATLEDDDAGPQT